MKRLTILLVLLLVTAGIYFFSIDKEDSKMDALNAERSFSIPADKIAKIVISERNKKPIVLTRNAKETWQVNQKYLARENAIDNLLEVIENVQLKYIPLKQAHKNILNEMKLIGVQVDLYDKNDTQVKSYQVGGSTPDERGTYLMMSKGPPKPFVVDLPSMEGSIRGRYILSELDWRDRAVIREDPKELRFINVKYHDQSINSFSINGYSNDYVVRDNKGQKVSIDPNKVKAYIDGFDEVQAEYIDNLNPLKDSITALQPFMTIDFGRTEEDYKSIRLFPLSTLLIEEEDLADADKVKLDGRYFVDCSWGDFMLVQHRLIGKLLRGKSFFEPE